MTCDDTIAMKQGDYYNEVKKVFVTDPLTDIKAPLNLTGYAVEFRAKSSLAALTYAISLSVGSGITLLDQAANPGWVRIEMITAVTATLPAGTYKYDVYAISPAGLRRMVAAGNLVIGQPVNAA